MSSQVQVSPYNKQEIARKVHELLSYVEMSPREQKFQYVIQIYDCLTSNSQFVRDHTKLYSVLKTNANTLVKDMVRILKNDYPEVSERESICQTIKTILNCVNIIDTQIN